MAKPKGINRKSRCLAAEAVDLSEPANHWLVNLIAAAPFRDAFGIAPRAIQELVYVADANHVAKRGAAAPLLVRCPRHRSPMQLERRRTKPTGWPITLPLGFCSMASIPPAILEH